MHFVRVKALTATSILRKKMNDMNHTHQLSKREYISPKLVCTILDISISLEMQSVAPEEPPAGPGEIPGAQNMRAPEYFNNNPVINA